MNLRNAYDMEKSEEEKQHVVYIPKIGTFVDSNNGGHYITKCDQERLIEDATKSWKRTINCPKQLIMVACMPNEKIHYPHLESKIVDNPYFGWKESQLKIVER